jgi:NAD(P)-dependent dehydrogenase (short-subunit alcohol dehydrogenase family)
MATSPPGRVVLVTGASSGIGRAVAHLLAERGDDLVLIARGRPALDAVVDECLSLGAASARGEALDVRDCDSVERAVQGLLRKHGRLDAVVNSAAVLAFGRFEHVPAEVFDGLVRTNVLGSANVARAVLPAFRSQRRGTLVLIGSVLGETAAPSMTPYVVSKWAVSSLARQLMIENNDLPDVRISLVAPGAVDTPIYRRAANYQGQAPKAPAPVVSPERVARTVVADLDRPRSYVGVGPLNAVMKLGFRLVPFAYDRVVCPLYRALGTSRLPVPATPGNVLEPVDDLEDRRTREPALAATGGS